MKKANCMSKKYIFRLLTACLFIVLSICFSACTVLNQTNTSDEPLPHQMGLNLRYFTANGDQIYFMSGSSLYKWQSGTDEVYLLSESVDGRYLQYIDEKIYYIDFDKGQLCFFDLQKEATHTVIQLWNPATQPIHPGYYGQWWLEDNSIYCVVSVSKTDDFSLTMGLDRYDLDGNLMNTINFPTKISDISLVYNQKIFYHQSFHNGITYVYDLETGSSSELLDGKESNFHDVFADEMVVCAEEQYYLYHENQLKSFPYKIAEGYGHYVAMDDDFCYTWEDTRDEKTLVKQSDHQSEKIIQFQSSIVNQYFWHNAVLLIQTDSCFQVCSDASRIINATNISEEQINELLSPQTTGRPAPTTTLAIYPDGTIYILNVNESHSS